MHTTRKALAFLMLQGTAILVGPGPHFPVGHSTPRTASTIPPIRLRLQRRLMPYLPELPFSRRRDGHILQPLISP